MKKLLFLGMPGSGKGTQAKLLEEKGFIPISIGEIMREAIKNKDKTIEPYKDYIAQGGLVPDKIIFDLIEKEVKNSEKYVLDGAVRTLPQAKFIKEKKLIDGVIFFTLIEEIAEKRILSRDEGREDDNKEVIHRRFEEYNKKTKPVIDFLKNHFEFHELDASPSIEEIHNKVVEVLGLEE
jgi:adenylate kinase